MTNRLPSARREVTHGVTDLEVAKLPERITIPVVVGMVTIIALVCGFGAWSVSAPIAGASVASGTLVANGQNKTVQHLHGGVVRTIFVQDGDVVETGSPLIELDGTIAQAQHDSLSRQLFAALALEARLLAERDGDRTLAFAQSLVDAQGDALVAELIADQTAEFEATLQRHEQELAILTQQVKANEEEIVGIEVQMQSNRKQLELIEQEIAVVQDLYDDGYATLDRLLALQRDQASLQGNVGEFAARIATIRQQIIEAQQRISRHTTARIEEALQELTTVRAEKAELANQALSARHALDRLVLVSPVDGVIVEVHVHSEDAVIAAGDTVLEILPTSVELVAEVQLNADDIDAITIGQSALLTLSALNPRTTPQISASVIYVSADVFVDDASGQQYYLSRLTLGDLENQGLERLDLYPGMRVEAYIETGERTFMEYLLKPLMETFRRAFREE
jgi:HlyD family type I secretion membrane fusion protein